MTNLSTSRKSPRKKSKPNNQESQGQTKNLMVGFKNVLKEKEVELRFLALNYLTCTMLFFLSTHWSTCCSIRVWKSQGKDILLLFNIRQQFGRLGGNLLVNSNNSARVRKRKWLSWGSLQQHDYIKILQFLNKV